MIGVTSLVEIYALDGEVQTGASCPTLVVESNSTYRGQVNLTVEGKTFTVDSDDLAKAIQNAANVGD